jgi:hypothetical protein
MFFMRRKAIDKVFPGFYHPEALSINTDCLLLTYQKKIRKLLAINSARQTSREKPSGSCVALICLYWGTYGKTPPTTIADAAIHPTGNKKYWHQFQIGINPDGLCELTNMANSEAQLIVDNPIHVSRCFRSLITLKMLPESLVHRFQFLWMASCSFSINESEFYVSKKM